MLSQSTMAFGADTLGKRARQQPAQNRPARRVDADDLQGAVHERQLDLVRPDEAGPDDVDQVPGRQVLGQEQLTGPALETGEVERLALELDASRADRADQCHRHEELAAADRGDDPGHGRMGLLAGTGDEVFHTADALAVAAQQGAADDAG